jgi:hypothetical protein
MNKDFYSDANMAGDGLLKGKAPMHNSSEPIAPGMKEMPAMTQKKFDPMGNTKSVDARTAKD